MSTHPNHPTGRKNRPAAIRGFLLALLICLSAFAGEAAVAPFQTGDTVCFVGDSITAGGSYHAVIEQYYATRFPSREIRYYNCGISGDTATSIVGDGKYRVQVDILAHKPTVATIMLGMNDVGRNNYQIGKTGPEVEAAREASLASYDSSMHKLIDSLKQAGARIVLITPSIYDETAIFLKEGDNRPGVDGALGRCADQMTAEALAAGINLALNTKTPQYRQSLVATDLLGQRRELGRKLRLPVAQRYGMSKSGRDVSDPAAVELYIKDLISKTPKDHTGFMEAALHGLATEPEDLLRYDALSVEIRAACQPKAHVYSLSRK